MFADQLLFTTLVFDENGMSLYKSGFDTPRRKISDFYLNAELEELTEIDSVQIETVLDENVKKILDGKVIGALNIAGGIADNQDTYGLGMIKKVNFLSIAGQEIPDMFPFPKSVHTFWAPKADLRAGMASPIGAKIVNIIDAKLPATFYINDECEEVRLNADDLDKVVIPAGISKIAFSHGNIPNEFDLTKFIGLREVCFSNGVKMPKNLYIPDNVKIDMGRSVDLSLLEKINVNRSTVLKSPILSSYLKRKRILYTRKAKDLSSKERGR